MLKPTTRLGDPLVGPASCNHLTGRRSLAHRRMESLSRFNPVVHSTLSRTQGCLVSQLPPYGQQLASMRAMGERLCDGAADRG
jgi:hypothetical protein